MLTPFDGASGCFGYKIKTTMRKANSASRMVQNMKIYRLVSTNHVAGVMAGARRSFAKYSLLLFKKT